MCSLKILATLKKGVKRSEGSPTLDLTIYFWIDTSQTSVARAKDAGLKAIKGAFDQAQIDMPLPAQTVYLVQ